MEKDPVTELLAARRFFATLRLEFRIVMNDPNARISDFDHLIGDDTPCDSFLLAKAELLDDLGHLSPLTGCESKRAGGRLLPSIHDCIDCCRDIAVVERPLLHHASGACPLHI